MLTRPRKQNDETKAERILIQAFNLMQTIIKNTFRVGVCVLCPLSLFRIKNLLFPLLAHRIDVYRNENFNFSARKLFKSANLFCCLIESVVRLFH